MSDRLEWVLLAYRLPREPSTPRITLWRKMHRLGALRVLDGLVALPSDARTREQLEWTADEVLAAGGEASVWLGRLSSARQEQELAARMQAAVAVAYRNLIAEAQAVVRGNGGDHRRTVARLRREYRRVTAKDFFPPPERETARRAIEDLARTVGVTA